MGLLDKIVNKTNEITDKVEQKYNEAVTPEYKEKVNRGVEKFDKGMTKAVDKVQEKYHETMTEERKEKLNEGLDKLEGGINKAVDKIGGFFSGNKENK